VREQHCVDLLGIEGESAVALLGLFAPSLEETAFEQQSFPVDFQQVL
jgi:hypothetical protein